MIRFPRSSGILAHVTSLPSEYGIGDMGPDAFAFLDLLVDMGQTVWQVLPLNPPARGNSPYSCYSVFASNPVLISPRGLADDGWLTQLPKTIPSGNTVDFSAASRLKSRILEQAFVESVGRLEANCDFNSFCNENAWWLDEFARFEAMMREFGSPEWTTWPRGLAFRDEQAIRSWEAGHEREILFPKFVQFLLNQQWNRLKRYANQNHIRIYGDLPIFVALESADVWANQSLFHLRADGHPSCVAGVPPDYFSENGQRWGNPLYRWDVMESNNFAWWTNRFRRAQEQFDLLRVDHFRGFEAYWEIPAKAETAVEGKWVKGPGTKPFDAARATLGELPIIAEDLGLITSEVHDLRDQLGFAPMRVLQFGFETEHDDFHRPNRYPDHCVAYTGTHDNDTVVGWYTERQQNGTSEIIDDWVTADEDLHIQLIRLVLESNADTVIIPLQDLLGLGNDSRMNLPGTADGNWTWRVTQHDLAEAPTEQLLELTRNTHRTS